MTDAIGTTTFGYTSAGLPSFEQAPWTKSKITFGYNSALLRSSLSLGGAGSDHEKLLGGMRLHRTEGLYSIVVNCGVAKTTIYCAARSTGLGGLG
jgi:hypothetical protein